MNSNKCHHSHGKSNISQLKHSTSSRYRDFATPTIPLNFTFIFSDQNDLYTFFLRLPLLPTIYVPRAQTLNIAAK